MTVKRWQDGESGWEWGTKGRYRRRRDAKDGVRTWARKAELGAKGTMTRDIWTNSKDVFGWIELLLELVEGVGDVLLMDARKEEGGKRKDA